jgi:AP-1 complex subunit beta-1
MEKLEIIIKLVSEKNIDQVLLELKEYATEVDVDFVRKAVSAIGRCAVKLERAAERCIGVLLELIQTKVNYVVQESVIVIKDIFRRYPNRYESIIATLCDNLDTLDEPLAKASMIWIIGEYAERIDNADELLDTFLETFDEEDPAVQLQLLTATVKLFLQSPEDTQEMVQRVLDMATEESDNPDLRDRGFIYWRLLSTDPEAAKIVVLGEKPIIEDDTYRIEPNLLSQLIGQIATLSSVFHKPPESFVVKRGAGIPNLNPDDEEDDDDDDGIQRNQEDDDDEDDDRNEYEDENDVGGGGKGAGPVDLLDMGGMAISGKGTSGGGAKFTPTAPMNLVCSPEKSAGIEIYAGFVHVNKKVRMQMEIHNVSSQTDVGSLAIQLNKNAFGLNPASQQIICSPPISIGRDGLTNVDLIPAAQMLAPPPTTPGQPVSSQIQVAIKNMTTGNVFYFAVTMNFEALFCVDGKMDRSTFIELWKSIDNRNELYGTVTDLPKESCTIDTVTEKFHAYHIYFIARRPVPNMEGQEVVYFSMRTITNMDFLAELTFKNGINACKVCIKTENASYGLLAKTAIESLLRG